jgi:hypothetical protein
MKPKITPIGIGDLMVLKKQWIRCEAGEPCHIENVMATESRGREHRRLRQIEETVVTEQERTEETMRELHTTERFELEQEMQKTIQSDTKFEAGAEVSAGFGPVQIGAYSRFSTSQTKTESQRNATNYAKEVTERSLNRLIERVRTERTLRTLEEFEEKNEHRFENAEGDNRTGIYRFVDSYYRARVMNYGKRLFYEFIVPEPAAFYIFARTFDADKVDIPPEPELPVNPDSVDPDNPEPLTAGDITRENYMALTQQYDAEGVSPPPPEDIVISKIIARSFSDPEQHWAFVDGDFEIPQGYRLSSWRTANSWNGAESFVLGMMHSVRRRSTSSPDIELEGDDDNEASIVDLTGVLPIAAHGFGIHSLLMSIRAVCELSPEGLEDWQLKTFNAIMAAYRKKLVEFQEQSAAAKLQAGVGVGGNHPDLNRAIEREELKKGCITLWTGFQYDAVPGISDDEDLEIPGNYPRIRIDDSLELAPDIQFLEQAFDWRNMAYEFYPYYWKRRTQWVDAYAMKDDDLLFTSFLRAGAARVIVPVHLSGTQAVLFYQLTGKLWSGGEVPLLDPIEGPAFEADVEETTDEELALYQAYVLELSEQDALDQIDKDIEISADDPLSWEIKVPTTLVWLQQEQTLPVLEE